MEDFKSRLVSGFFWEATTRFIVQIVSWVSTIWVARLLTPDDYGLVGISGIFTGLCLTISGLGLTNALVNKSDVTRQEMSNVFWTGMLLAIIFYLVLYFLAPIVANYYGFPELEAIIRVAGIMVLISPLTTVPRAIVLRKMQFKLNALIVMFSNFLVTITALSLAFLGWQYWSLIISTVAGEVFILVAFLIMAKFVPCLPRNVNQTMPLYVYGVNILGARLISYLSHNLPIIILSNFVGKASVGQYQLSNTVAGLPMDKIGQIFSSIAFPSFSRIKNDREMVKNIFLKMNGYLFLIIAPMFVGIAFTAPEFVPLVLGEQWQDAVIPIQIICLANILSGSAMLVPKVFEGIGLPSASMKYESVIVVISPFAMMAGVGWGLNGLLMGWALVIPVGYIYLLNVLFKNLDMNLGEFFNSIKTTFICLVIMIIALLVLDSLIQDFSNVLIVLLLKVTVGAMFFCTSIWFLDRQKVDEFILEIRQR